MILGKTASVALPVHQTLIGVVPMGKMREKLSWIATVNIHQK